MVIHGGWPVSAKHCDTCKSATAAVFCRDDVAFLCFGCDSRIHRTDTKFPVRHERVWLCDVCEQAPASITCRADAATLCVSCDADIHSANNLASRHDRVPIEPFFDAAESIDRSASLGLMLPPAKIEVCGGMCRQDDLEAVSWLLPNLNHGDFKVMEGAHMKVAPAAVVGNHGLFLNEMESLLDLEFGNSGIDRFHSAAMDNLVPTHTKPVPALANTVITQNRPQENCLGIDFCRSKLSSFGYLPPSLTQNVSLSSLDVGVVPEGPLSNNSADPSLTNTASSFTSHPTQLFRTDREARVLRYREKRKNRKFEKTIRYASRKAYAETRPRIKGRFAKQSETEIEIESDIDNYFFSSDSAAFMVDAPYGGGPTF